jgi:hypothetical protein
MKKRILIAIMSLVVACAAVAQTPKPKASVAEDKPTMISKDYAKAIFAVVAVIQGIEPRGGRGPKDERAVQEAKAQVQAIIDLEDNEVVRQTEKYTFDSQILCWI